MKQQGLGSIEGHQFVEHQFVLGFEVRRVGVAAAHERIASGGVVHQLAHLGKPNVLAPGGEVCFAVLRPRPTPRRALLSNIDLKSLNTAYTPSAKKSEGLDFADVDRIDDKLFNDILWKGLRGENTEVLAPRRSAFVRVTKGEEDE